MPKLLTSLSAVQRYLFRALAPVTPPASEPQGIQPFGAKVFDLDVFFPASMCCSRSGP